MMKKTIFTAMLTALVISAGAADYDYLVFTLTDGNTKAIAASNLNITFTGGNLVATSGTETLATIALSELSKMEFSNDGTAGISAISVDELTIDGGMSVYDLNGRKLPTVTKLSRGIYILKGNGRTLKVQVK